MWFLHKHNTYTATAHCEVESADAVTHLPPPQYTILCKDVNVYNAVYSFGFLHKFVRVHGSFSIFQELSYSDLPPSVTCKLTAL